MYHVKINGTRHTVTVLEDGSTHYDPPLSKERVARDKRNIDDICKSRKCPGVRTDTTWHANRGTLLDQMDGDEVYTNYLVKESIKNGYTPGANDVYIGQMADFDGDRKAWFKPGEGRSELAKRAKAAGKGVEMPGLSVAPAPYVEKPACKLNPSIVKKLARHYRSTGEGAGMNDAELAAHVVKKHGKQD
jgi:hypothetical protein